MREIKFRAWCIKDKKMYSDIQSFYDNLSRSSDQQCWDCASFGCFLNNKDFFVMQYTGLKDKNGVEVYEGDVLKGLTSHYGEIIGEVKLCQYDDDDGFVHGVHYGWNVNGVPLMDLIEQGFEVVGNIHENPELITNGN